MSFEDKAKAYANNLDIDKFLDCPSLDEAPWPVVAAFGSYLGECGVEARNGCISLMEQYWPGFLDNHYTEFYNRKARAEVTDYWATIRQDALAETV